jgi:hypothetical protein
MHYPVVTFSHLFTGKAEGETQRQRLLDVPILYKAVKNINIIINSSSFA